jgi:hypothetical protein
MNKIFKKNFLNFFIFILFLTQAFLFLYNEKPSHQVLSQKNISLENFSSIVLSKSGLTLIGSEQLNKIDENTFFLHGKSYLENERYKIYGNDISINLTDQVSQSKKVVQIINSMGILSGNGFKSIDNEGKIYFDGEVVFTTYD